MRCFLAPALLAFGLSTPAVAGAPQPVPLPWRDAGFAFDHPQVPALSVRVCTTAFVCSSAEPDPTAGHVVVDLEGVHLEFDAVSSVSSNRWEWGFENIVLNLPAGIDTVSAEAVPVATFEVPSHTRENVVHVAFRRTDQGYRLPTSALGFERVEPFVPGDSIRQDGLMRWSVDAISDAEPTTTCNYAPGMPGIVLDDCTATMELFRPKKGRGRRR